MVYLEKGFSDMYGPLQRAFQICMDHGPFKAQIR